MQQQASGADITETPQGAIVHHLAHGHKSLVDLYNRSVSQSGRCSSRGSHGRESASSVTNDPLQHGSGRLAPMEDPLLGAYSDFEASNPNGLGTFLGVFVPCTCTIFGVVVFLRLGFVVGQAGVWLALLLVFVAFVLCLLTTLSLCALISAAGDEMAAGGSDRQSKLDPGVYAALRKSVGPELGAALGAAFYLAFTVDVAFYLSGFSETLCASLDLRSSVQVFPWNRAGSWLETLISSLVLVLLALVCSCGVRFSAKVSLLTLGAIVAVLLVALICLLAPTYDPTSGETKLNATTFAANSWPQLSGSFQHMQASVSLLFALTFPGFTGFLAGSNLSGELRMSTRSIVRGTLGSLCFVWITYSCICLTLAASVQRPELKSNLDVISTVVQGASHVPIGYVGVACTTLSSALSYLLGAPRVLRAVVRDAGVARLTPLAASSSSSGEPLRALGLTWGAVQLILLTGTVDLLALGVA